MLSKVKENSIYKYFIFLSLFLGIIFSILIPLYQVPDEEVHINAMYSHLGINIDFSEETNSYGDTERIIRNYNEKVDVKNYFDLKDKIDIIKKTKKIDIHLIRYMPQMIGMIIGELINLPIIFSITLAEILAVVFYTLIGGLTLKLIPIKKEIMMLIMLLPIGIQQMGSFSYDMMLNSLSFLFIAYIFNLRFKKNAINNYDLIKLLLILLTISLIKIPYILLGLLIFIIPLKKIQLICSIINNKKKKKILVLSLLLLMLMSLLLVNKISYIKVLVSFIINPIDSIMLLFRTLKEHLAFYAISIMGYFGWHDTPVSVLFGVFIIVGIFIINFLSKSKYENNKLSKKENIYIFSLGIFLSLIIIISLFDWTLNYNGIDTSEFTISDFSYHIKNTYDILGVQGRYFLPIIPLLIIPIDLIKQTKNKNQVLKITQIVYYIIIFIYMFVIILNRYWL